jgi:DNA-binding IclR family transcriptional regulator
VLDLLEYFAANQRPATLSEISEHFGWLRSSTFNILSTLVDKGFLYEPKIRAGFYPSPRWLTLSQTIVDAQPLPSAVYALTQEFMNETGETSVIVAPAGVSAIFVDVAETAAPALDCQAARRRAQRQRICRRPERKAALC